LPLLLLLLLLLQVLQVEVEHSWGHRLLLRMLQALCCGSRVGVWQVLLGLVAVVAVVAVVGAVV
jgi:hypothetical protein